MAQLEIAGTMESGKAILALKDARALDTLEQERSKAVRQNAVDVLFLTRRASELAAEGHLREAEALRAYAEQARGALNDTNALYDKLKEGVPQARLDSDFRRFQDQYAPNYAEEYAKIEALKAAHPDASEMLDRARRDTDIRRLDTSTNWQDGLERGFKKLNRDATDFASQTERIVTNSFASMEDALVQFSMTGKASFGDMARSIIADMMKMQIRASITAPLSGMLGNVFGGGLFGGGKTGSAGIMPGEWEAAAGHANGGYISGPGTSRSDSIMARLSNGEFVVNADATSRYRSLLHAINDNRVPAFADGGYIGDMAPLTYGPEASPAVAAPPSSNISISSPVTVTVNGSASGDSEADGKFANEVAAKTVKRLEESMRTVVVSEIMKQMRPGGMMNRL